MHFSPPLGHRHARDTRGAHDTALRVAFGQQLVYLRVLRRFGHGGGHKLGLVATALALIADMAAARATTPN